MSFSRASLFRGISRSRSTAKMRCRENDMHNAIVWATIYIYCSTAKKRCREKEMIAITAKISDREKDMFYST